MSPVSFSFAFFNILHFQLFLEVTALEDVMNEATFTTIGWKMCREALTAVTCFHRFLLNNLVLVFLENFKNISEHLHYRSIPKWLFCNILVFFHKFCPRTTVYKFLLKKFTISCFYQLYEHFTRILKLIIF